MSPTVPTWLIAGTPASAEASNIGTRAPGSRFVGFEMGGKLDCLSQATDAPTASCHDLLSLRYSRP